MTTIHAQSREGTGKGVARKMRREGRIPAVLYGAGRENRNLSLNAKEWIGIIEKVGGSLRTQRQNLVIDGGEGEMVLLRGYQVHPVSGSPIHVDFSRFNAKQRVVVEVPVVLTDTEICKGLKTGGIIEQIRRVLEVHCLADEIPDHIEISVANMDVGDSFHIDDLRLAEGVVVNHESNFTIVTIGAPTVAEEGDVEEAGETDA